MNHFAKFYKNTLLTVLVALIKLSSLTASEIKPNIIFLLVDDMGYADVSCFGSTFYETPNIDALAKQGMKFMNAYTAGSICSPTRASIITGKYPVRTGITDWIPGQKISNPKLIQPKPGLFLDPEEITFAEILRKNGYATFYAGKWHLGEKDEYNPLSQGFEEYYSGKELRKDKSTTTTDSLTTATETFITKKSKEKKPFFAYLSYYDVHTPIYQYPDFIAHYKNKATKFTSSPSAIIEHDGLTRPRQDDPAYGSLVSAIDKSVENISRLIKNLGIEKNTIVVFTSDNGGLSTTNKGGPTSNAPYRSGKGWLYEGGIRVPLIIKYPGVVKAASTNSEPTMSTDFYPSMLEWAGLPAMPKLHKDGLSLVQLLKGQSKLNRQDLFWHYPHYHGSTWAPGAAIRSGDWKLISFYESGISELYNLKNDPYEKKNMSADQPDIVKLLKTKLENWQKETGAKIPVPNPDYDPKLKKTKISNDSDS